MGSYINRIAFTVLTVAALQLNGRAQDVTTIDTAYYASLIHSRVNHIYPSKNGAKWIIAGQNNEQLFNITPKGEVLNMKDSAKIPENTQFTDVLFIKNNSVLVGTKNRYAYQFNDSKVAWINSDYGLTDSTIEYFKWDSHQKLLFVQTAHSRFLVKHHSKPINIRFSEVKDTLTTFDEIRLFLKKNFRWHIQKGICVVAADIDFSFRPDKFIGEQDLLQIKESLLPGDLIIKRNDKQLANVGIPGFWTHSGIYIGSLDMLDSCLANTEMLGDQKPSAYIKDMYPEVYEKMVGRKNLIIEGVGEGVVISPVEHIAKVDYLAALRTNLDKNDILKSLLSAFEYLGTPYDYLFDFSNDNELVCSELIYLSFRPSPSKNGVSFTMGQLDGETFLSPNDIAKQFSMELDQPTSQFKLVFFYDAKKRLWNSIMRNEEAFAKSWKRNI